MFNLNTPLMKNITAGIALVVSVVSGYIAIDTRYAKANQLKAIELRVEQKIVSDSQRDVQKEIWTYEDRYKVIEKAPAEVVQRWRSLKLELQNLNTELDTIRQKAIKQQSK